MSRAAATVILAIGVAVIGGSVAGGIALAHGNGPDSSTDGPGDRLDGRPG